MRYQRHKVEARCSHGGVGSDRLGLRRRAEPVLGLSISFAISVAASESQPGGTGDTFSATVQSGLVTITLTVPPGWSTTTGMLKLLITDKDPCGPRTYCSTKATITLV